MDKELNRKAFAAALVWLQEHGSESLWPDDELDCCVEGVIKTYLDYLEKGKNS